MLVPKTAKIVSSQGGFVTIPEEKKFFKFDGSKIYIETFGEQDVKIFRAGNLATILSGKPGEKLSVSGDVKSGDVFLLGTSVFFETFTKENLNSLYQSDNKEDSLKSGALMASFIDVPKTSPIEFLKKFIPERKIKITLKEEPGFEPDSKSKKTTFSVGVILLIILAISIGFGVIQKRQKEEEAQRVAAEQEVKNREASGFYEVTPDLFLDLTLLSAGFKGDSVSVSGGKLYVLDKNSKKIISVETETKKSDVVAGQGKLNEAFDLASYEDRVFVSDSEGIKEIDGDINTAVEKDWEGEVLIQAFAGNLYVLDKNAGAIYRFSGSETGFGSKQNWLSASTKPDFSDARAWTFDGAIYVLTGSKVVKFSQGSPQAFSIASEVLSVTSIYADEENQYLYVLDKDNGKVIVTEKDGKFKAQYSSDQIKEAVNVVSSEAEKKIILLTGEKLLSIEMKHI